VISLIWRKRHGVRAHDELALADVENENRVETLRCRGRGKISPAYPASENIDPKITTGLFSFRGSMGVNPLACPSRSRPNPPISVRNSSAACRTSESTGEAKEEAKGFRASLFILVTPLLRLRVAGVLSNIVPETKTLHSPIN